MANIRNTGTSKRPYRVDYFNLSNQRRRVSFETYKEAKRFLEAHKAEKLRRREECLPDWFDSLTMDKNLTVGQLFEQYLTNKIELKEKDSAKRTAIRGIHPIVKWFENVKVVDLRPSDILDFQRRFLAKGRTKNSCHQYVARLKSMLRWATKNKIIAANPIADVEVEKGGPKEKKALTRKQVSKFARKLAEHGEHEVLDLFLTGINGCFRIGEMYKLTWSHVDFQKNEIHLTKDMVKTKQSPRDVPMNATVREILRRRRLASKGSEYVFWHPAQSGYISTKVNRLSKRFLKENPHGPHHWRTTFATLALRGRTIRGADGKDYPSRADIKSVAAVGGWAGDSKILLSIYAKCDEDQKRSVVNLVDTGLTGSDTQGPQTNAGKWISVSNI